MSRSIQIYLYICTNSLRFLQVEYFLSVVKRSVAGTTLLWPIWSSEAVRDRARWCMIDSGFGGWHRFGERGTIHHG